MDTVIWDGVDFTPCFRDRYIANAPLVLIAVLGAGLAVAAVRRRLRKGTDTRTTVAALVPPHGDNISRLEANVFLAAVATNLLPFKGGAPSRPLPARDSEKVIDEFRDLVPPRARRWEAVRWGVALFGAALWLGAQLGVTLFVDELVEMRALLFPAFVLLLTFIPGAPVTVAVTLHLPFALILFRSVAIGPYSDLTHSIPVVIECLYWSALISIPYYDELDCVLAGAVSHGGGTSGTDGKAPANIEEPTSPFSRATFAWVLPFLWKYYWTPIVENDIPAIREDDCAAASVAGFRAMQAARDRKYAAKYDGAVRKRNLGIDLSIYFLPLFNSQFFFGALYILFMYLEPIGLRLLLGFFKERDRGANHPSHIAWLYVAMMALGQAMGPIVMGQSLAAGRRVCIRMRAIIVAEVFAKALRRQDRSGAVDNSKSTNPDEEEDEEKEKGGTSDGKVTNLVSVDAFTVSEVCAYVFYLVSCPLAIVLNIWLLYETLGPASLAGIAVLILMLPVQTFISKLYTVFQRRLLSATDKRLDTVTEVIAHIKLIKFNSWESKFYDRMMGARKKELSALAQRFALTTFWSIVAWGTPVLVTAAAFSVHILILKQPLTAERAFPSLVLFNMLRDPLALSQDTIMRLLQSYTSCTRIQEYLDEPDTLKYKQLSTPGHSDPTIGFRDAVLGHPGQEKGLMEEDEEEGEQDADEPAAPVFRLGELDLSFPVGKLSLVTGPVGSGKTTLILSLLGETVLLKGKIFMPDDKANRDLCPTDPVTGLKDTVAYCAQTAWLLGATIRDNITFGSAWDKERYDAVVYACALLRDFEIFENGDATEVGEKGTTCSGGQKARIALARALYSPARTVILDDVLSAVDAQTAKHIFTHVLQGPLMDGRTCILVTHQVNLCLTAASLVVMLDDGKVVASGSPAELIASGTLEVTESEAPTPMEREFSIEVINKMNRDRSLSVASGHVEDNIEDNLDGAEHDALLAKKNQDAQAAAVKGKDSQLVADEATNHGSVDAATYALYFRSQGGLPFWAVVFLIFVGTQALQILTNTWVRGWTNATAAAETARGAVRAWVLGHSDGFYLGVYCAISGFFLLGIAMRVGITFFGSLRASKVLYSGLLKQILGAKMRFFDSTPSGRILNRLSKDMSSIDQEAGEILGLFANCVLSCIAVLLVVASSTPTFLINFAVIFVLYWIVGALYVATSREIKRYDSTSRSPIFISFSEALVGVSTIRSYGDSARFITKLLGEIDANTRCFYYLWQTNRILANACNIIGCLITISAAALALNSQKMNASDAGLSITYALSFTDYVLWVVRLYAQTEMTMNSVERVGEYLDLDVEEHETDRGVEPPAYWPTRDGTVVVENLTCKYAPQLEPVLRDVSFTIEPKEKIGICGRTGSGKSTLALSFFRFLHQEGGRILIDGLDIGKLSLSTLRSRLTILPQEAQLFSGTIRDNMDPFEQHEDYEVWEALRQCGLAGRTPGASASTSRAASRAASRAVSRSASALDLSAGDGDGKGDTSGGERMAIRSLDEQVAVGGKNFSQGQRQLLALARGLLKLRSSAFLIMDESTANLDHATDTTIQNVIRTGLADTQMLVIAHRLLTVCGLDKILVLDRGRVVEYGTPWELLQKEDGSFRDLCRQSGEEAQLFELARSVHDRKRESVSRTDL